MDTVPDLVCAAADRFGPEEAIIDGPARLTFENLAERMEIAAGAFRSAGIGGVSGPGEHTDQFLKELRSLGCPRGRRPTRNDRPGRSR